MGERKHELNRDAQVEQHSSCRPNSFQGAAERCDRGAPGPAYHFGSVQSGFLLAQLTQKGPAWPWHKMGSVRLGGTARFHPAQGSFEKRLRIQLVLLTTTSSDHQSVVNMPRSSRSSGSSRSAPSGSRGAHTMAAPQQKQQSYQQHPQAYGQQSPAMAQQQQPRAPGLFGQMASTAAGVAVGSTVGHGLSNMLFGGGSAPAEQAQQAPPQEYQQGAYQGQQQGVGMSCEAQSKDFIKCLESSKFHFVATTC